MWAPSSTQSRNLVNLTDKNIATDWNVEDGKVKNVKWSATVGSRGYVTPVIADGRVFVSTNNKPARDKKIKGLKAILLCFAEKDGKFLWQTAYDVPRPPVDDQAKEDGLCSAPAVENGRLYLVTPTCVVVCADVKDGKTLWSYDMMKELKVYPCIINACTPLLVGDTLYVVTANGVDNNGDVPVWKAPSIIALHKKDGKLKWENNLPGKNIIHGQWSNPAWAEVNGKGQVIFPGGDGYLYGLEPETGNMIWKFLCCPVPKGKDKEKRNYLVSTPVVYGNRVYIGVGAAPETGYGERVGHFWCIDITKKGDVSTAKDNYDPKSPANKNSALVWHHGGEINPRPKSGRSLVFNQTISTAAIHDGLVYIPEETGYLNCLDAKTGTKYWEYDLKAVVWGSPYWVDGKVYLGDDNGDVHIFAHGKQMKLIRTISIDEAIQCGPVAANGVLYIRTRGSKLFAIGGAK